jgi:hypothetical protein
MQQLFGILPSVSLVEHFPVRIHTWLSSSSFFLDNNDDNVIVAVFVRRGRRFNDDFVL